MYKKDKSKEKNKKNENRHWNGVIFKRLSFLQELNKSVYLSSTLSDILFE